MITVTSPILPPEMPGLMARIIRQMNDMQARIEALEAAQPQQMQAQVVVEQPQQDHI